MGFQIITEPTELILTLGETKDHLRIKSADEDSLIETLIMIAGDWISDFLRRSLVTQELEYTINKFPKVIRDAEFNPRLSSDRIPLPFSPLQSITDIKYIDLEGTEITWPTTEYSFFINEMPGFVKLAFNKSYPSTQDVQDAIKITYISGYVTREKIPPVIKQAALLLVGHLFERREETIAGTIATKIPMGIESLIYPHRMFTP